MVSVSTYFTDFLYADSVVLYMLGRTTQVIRIDSGTGYIERVLEMFCSISMRWR